MSACLSCWAETRYVTDQFEITMRSGAGPHHEIIRLLDTGTSVQALSDDQRNGYTKVRLRAGGEGWVLSHYLIAEPVARDQLAEARMKLEQAIRRQREMEQSSQSTKEEKAGLEKQYKQVVGKAQKLKRALTEVRSASANAIAINEEKNLLSQRLLAAQQQLDTAREQIEDLRDKQTRNWFITGAAVFGAGILFGILLPKIRGKSRYGEFQLRVP